MNKELLIALMQKDLAELNVMLEGIGEWERIPAPIAKLALAKAENIVASLHDLAQMPQPTVEPKVEQKAVEAEAIDNSVEETSQVEAQPEPQPMVEPEAAQPEMVVAESVEVSITTETVENEEETITVQETIAVSTVADLVDSQPSLNEVQKREESVIDSVINKVKITDLIQSISLGDRFRFQRELFDNNGEQMMQAFYDLNATTSLEEAMCYIEKHFRWDAENESVKDFMALLNRKF